jgi:outer membrane lipoprotein-sorting protein
MKALLLCIISLLGLLNTKAQTADDIIKKWTNAMGGSEKLASIKTVYTENEISVMNNPAAGKTYIVNGKGFKSVIDLSGQLIIDCYTVNGGWSINPLAGQPTAVNMPEAQVKLGQLSLDASGPLYNYGSKGSKVELLGKEDLKGNSAYKIKLTTATGTEVLYYISDSSYYILENVAKMNVNGQDIEITTALSDYRKTAEGFIMPYASVLDFPGLTIAFTNKKIEINKDIDPAIFEMPKN